MRVPPLKVLPRLNALATLILGVLLMLSAILVVTTAFPHVNVARFLIALSARPPRSRRLGFAATSIRARSRTPAADDDMAVAKEAYKAALAAARAERARTLDAARATYAETRATAKTAYNEALRRRAVTGRSL